MKVQTFRSKVSSETLQQMDLHINEWMEENNIQPKFINQSFGYEIHRQSGVQEPVVVISVWY